MAELFILCVIVLIDFSTIKPSLNSFNKSYIIMADSLIFCGTEFVCVLLKILDPLFMGEIPLGFHFLDHLHSLGGAWGPSHIYLG